MYVMDYDIFQANKEYIHEMQRILMAKSVNTNFKEESIMKERNVEKLILRNVRLIFRNFSGREGKYNKAGQRNFGVIIDDENLAETLNEIGWNVKILAPRDETDEPIHYLPVAVEFEKGRPPKVVMICRDGQVELDEETIGELDYAEIISAKVTIRPYQWSVNGNSGIKGYLKTMYVEIDEDEFASDYISDEDDELPM